MCSAALSLTLNSRNFPGKTGRGRFFGHGFSDFSAGHHQLADPGWADPEHGPAPQPHTRHSPLPDWWAQGSNIKNTYLRSLTFQILFVSRYCHEHAVCVACNSFHPLCLSRSLSMRWTPTESRSWLWRRPALSFALPAWSRTWFWSRTCCSASRPAGTSWSRGHWTEADTWMRPAKEPNR